MRWKGDTLTECEYDLKGRFVVQRILVEDDDPHAMYKKINYENQIALFIPDLNSEAQTFLRAWLPEGEKEHFELSVFFKSPINSPARCAIMKPNARSSKPHLFIMSKGVVEDIIKLKARGELNIYRLFECTTFSEKDDEIADKMKESSGDFDVVSPNVW